MPNLTCVECGKSMNLSTTPEAEKYICGACGHVYPIQDGIVVAWPKSMGELALEEAHYHDEFDEDAGDVHQLTAHRNKFYHDFIHEYIRKHPAGRALEVGAGSSGTEAKQVIQHHAVVETDISPDTLKRLRNNLPKHPEAFVAADGEHIPFEKASFDIVYMVATFHHFEHPEIALAEFARVLKPGGLLVMGVEPNTTYFKPIKHLRKHLCRATHMNPAEGSKADAMMEGFTYAKLKQLLDTPQWSAYTIRPMWLFAGFTHYALEFLYRAFKMKKRISLPKGLEKSIVRLDEFLFTIPGFKHVGWHWIITAHRSEK